MVSTGSIGIIIIGRNEGDRLQRCFDSLPVTVSAVYVDSGSSDSSVALAGRNGIAVVQLGAPPNHTAARARNAGLEWHRLKCPGLSYVMLIDGDCQLAPGWLAVASRALDENADFGLVFGRRREQNPQNSIYNRLCDLEWDRPVGEALTAGGDVFCRMGAITAIGGYRGSMIAGEDPDMAWRLRADGWKIHRLDADMTVHDAAIHRFSQWWRRAQRSGHAFAELAHLHPSADAPGWARQCNSIIAWGGALPAAMLACLFCGMVFGRAWYAAGAVPGLLWMAQLFRLTAKHLYLPASLAFAHSWFLLIGKCAQACGLAQFTIARITGKRSQLIEYKSAGG